MEDNRIQNQIAIYMTNKKLCEFTDKLKPAPIEYYAHMHAQGEEQADGFRAYACIGVVLQDYSNGTGDKTVRVTANLSPGFFPFALSRMQNDLDRFDFTEDKIFGEPDEHDGGVAADLAGPPPWHRPSRGEHLSASLFHDGRTNGPAVIPIIISLWSAARSVGYGGNYAANTLFQM